MKRIFSIALSALLAAAVFTGCAKKDVAEGQNPENNVADNNENAVAETITVAASSTPHAEILEQVKDVLAEQGYELDIRVMDDYVTPNTATEGGDVDANYFQHQPYLDQFNEENGTHLVSIAKIHYEPYGIYAGTSDSLDLADGAKVAVPNDATNEARALQLLAAQGLITLADGAGLTATTKDIIDNPKNLEIVEMEAALLPSVLPEVDVAVINGNYAIGAGLKVSEALATEDAESEAAQTFANILVVKEGNENLPKLQALKDALLSDSVRDYIDATYDGAVVAIF